jgi:hypothetical protein
MTKLLESLRDFLPDLRLLSLQHVLAMKIALLKRITLPGKNRLLAAGPA